MVGLVLAMAVINLGLGYLTAMALVEPPVWVAWRRWLPKRRPRAAKGAVTDPAAGVEPTASDPQTAKTDTEPVLPVLPAVAPIDELPADWLAQLSAAGIVAQSFAEAVAHAVRLEIGVYREQLVAAECRTRSLVADGDAAGLARVADDLRTFNQDWLDKQTAAADMLTQRSGRLGDHEQAASSLEQALLDQAVQIRTACGALESLDAASELAQRGKRLMEHVTTLLIQAHALRDRILDLLAAMIWAGGALDSYGPLVQRDALTKLPNRIGLESLLEAWRRDDSSQTRLLSAILIDVDRFGRLNGRLGTRSGDGAIVAVARAIEDSLAKDRGFERLVRLGGAEFGILLGDVGPHQALTSAERLRQAVEATTFDDEGTEFDVTISCGVIEIKQGESSLDVIRRAHETLRFAKKAGRNRCALDKGDGPAMLDPPQFPVKARVISLRGAALEAVNASPDEVRSTKDEGRRMKDEG